MSGRYAIVREGKPVGEEHFTVSSSASVWRVEGRVEITTPVEQSEGYRLDIDERTLEPLEFEVWLEIMGEREEVHGVRDAELFRVRTHAISGEHAQDLSYVPGTVIDFASPMFNVLPVVLISHLLHAGASVPVRAIRVSIPALDASTELETYEFHGEDAGVRRVAVQRTNRRPTALWVRQDGLPTRVRMWIDDGAPFELQLRPD
jgi:hypothetical protein